MNNNINERSLLVRVLSVFMSTSEPIHPSYWVYNQYMFVELITYKTFHFTIKYDHCNSWSQILISFFSHGNFIKLQFVLAYKIQSRRFQRRLQSSSLETTLIITTKKTIPIRLNCFYHFNNSFLPFESKTN